MLLLKNAHIYPQTDETPFEGDVLCDAGKIVEIGRGLAAAADARILDLSGLHLLPGLIDCHSHIGLQDPRDVTSLDQITETSHPVTPQARTLYGADPASPFYRDAVRNGVTTVGIIPGSTDVVCGSGFASKTWGNSVAEMCIRDNICLKAALGENPKGFYQEAGHEPDSRMGATFLLAEYLHDARAYLEKKEAGAGAGAGAGSGVGTGAGELVRNDRYEAAIPVLKRETPLRVHCTHNDMVSVIELLAGFDIRFTLEHAWGSMCYLDEIVGSGCAVIYGPTGGRRSFFESRRTDIEAVGVLDRRGVDVSLTVDAPLLGFDGLLCELEESVRQGADPLRAMRMLTINPAKVMGVEDRVGSVEIGKDANFAIFRGVPGVNMGARVIYTVCEGQEMRID